MGSVGCGYLKKSVLFPNDNDFLWQDSLLGRECYEELRIVTLETRSVSLPDVRRIVNGVPWRLKQAARELGVSKMTLWRYVVEGRKRESDGTVVKLAAIRGPDRAFLTDQESWVRFHEELNGGPAE